MWNILCFNVDILYVLQVGDVVDLKFNYELKKKSQNSDVGKAKKVRQEQTGNDEGSKYEKNEDQKKESHRNKKRKIIISKNVNHIHTHH